MYRIVCISDTHSLHDKMSYDLTNFIDEKHPTILIHAGDCTNIGRKQEVEEFVYWFQNIKGFDTKIFIAGNHDWAFQRINEPHHPGDFDWYNNLMNEENLSQSDVVYLEDSEFIINDPNFSRPIKFYGSPWQPEFYNWAFNLPRNGEELKEKWSSIPKDTDVLIVHGPPHNTRDFVPEYGQFKHVGCELLRDRILELNIPLSIHGHIHYAHGVELLNNTLIVNASLCTESYNITNHPIVIDLSEVDGQLIATYVEV